MVGMAANSIAGGGTLLTFPALVGLGVPSLVANATSTVALWPGSLTSMYGYRQELRGARVIALAFTLPSILGGLLGGILLTLTTQRQFDHIVPWLVGFATLVFTLQRPILAALRRWSLAHPARENPASHGGDFDPRFDTRRDHLPAQRDELSQNLLGGGSSAEGDEAG